MERMKVLSQKQDEAATMQEWKIIPKERMKVLSQKQDECSEAELSSRFQKVEQQTAELAAVTPEAAVGVPTNLSHYVDDANFIYQDFARRGTESINTFRIQDYSWEDHGYSLVDG